jgi:hypothetical protein
LDGEELLTSAPCEASPGFAHLGWGPAEIEFALALAGARLELRPALASIYRELRSAGRCEGERLAGILRGEGPYPRSAADCARLVRVLLELELIEVNRDGDRLEIQVREGAGQVRLEESPTYRSCLAGLSEIRARFAGRPAQAA